jgi:uncharacterized protein YndB with AHSA1/START domain
MPVGESPDGRRFFEIEVEVPGTPEEVWQAIATGPGITSWFVPTELEERVGGSVVFHLGDVDDSRGSVTAWEPPRRLAYEEPSWNPPAPPLATEHSVEARSGGTCIVRIVSSLFTSSADWDDQLESMDQGWRPYFEILRLVLAHFRGLPAVTMQQIRTTRLPHTDAWTTLAGPLGLEDVSVGSEVSASAPGVPSFKGVIEGYDTIGTLHNALIRLTEPAPGIAAVTAHVSKDETYVSIGFYLFGDSAAEVVQRDTPRWKAYMDSLLPSPAA